ncbi:MAG: hypothetical protein A2785_02855 [Candidatus Chisholmbacteria bacterium RIFCSPHIGHO2_01_FULL_49_18]|uniref:Uncharacterized protein n=2 Tax=Candidatus Chisholmiibacteriota TaxID=1817900 RepID=A0A1G1VM97_9BACT|nr:MAG: hypothetical protein A2785_02855 [Candidatus Chisholmbacteria bacterium RIFCSPHIGHO2_01_FULL_49_18]OGY21030.1 MAG: hypothetical protein A3A65_01835 [Candidatus Chisholmbacteria bacterium RIFCSPLOWO2_01_FULL_49_14]
MINREQRERAIQAASPEESRRLKIFIRTIVDGWRKGYKVAFVDRQGLEEETAADIATYEIRMTQLDQPLRSAAQVDLEDLAWKFLESELDMLAQLTTDLAFFKGEADATHIYYFPLDEIE